MHPARAAGEVARDVAAAHEAVERNRAPDGLGWTDVHVVEEPSVSFTDVGLTFAAADAALAPIMPRVRKFAATIGGAIGRDVRDPYGSYEDDAYCYAHAPGCFIKLDGKDGLVARIWFEASTDDNDGLPLLRRGLEAIDALTPSIIADYWIDCTGAVRDVAFMDKYMRRLSGEE